MSWFVTAPIRAALPARRLRLFAFPHAGRGASLFYPWRAEVPSWIELIAVQLPGREGRIDEPALARLDQMVAALLPEIATLPDQPYAFFGHSMGAKRRCASSWVAIFICRPSRGRCWQTPARLPSFCQAG